MNVDLRRARSSFWILSGFLTLLFFAGGSVRSDVQSLAILRPVSFILCGYALWSTNYNDLKNRWFVFSTIFAVCILICAQLVPLPPALWKTLAGRQLISEIDSAAILADLWRPVTIDSASTENSFFALVPALTAFLFAARCNIAERRLILLFMLVIALMSGLWGLLQTLGGADSTLYTYTITNREAGVGLFANRNHQAVLLACVFPMLAVYASFSPSSPKTTNVRLTITALVGSFVIPVILVTGSRAGLITGVISLASAFFIFQRKNLDGRKNLKTNRLNLWVIPSVLAVLMFATITIVMSRAKAVERIVSADQLEDLRLKMWMPIYEASFHYLPFGTGSGTFSLIYKKFESDELILITYVNQAHNDWLDLLLTSGYPGIAVALFILVGYFRVAQSALTSHLKDDENKLYQRLGLVITGIVGLASVVDYPLRAPYMAAFFMIGVAWLRPPEEEF